MAGTNITRTQVAGNRKKFTISAWVKRSKISYDYSMWFCAGVYNSSQMAQAYWASDNMLRFGAWESNGANHHYLTTKRLYRDTNAWYHIVIAVDTTQSTESDRVKIYTNGVLETSFHNDGQTYYPTQNYDYPFNNNGSPNAIGTRPSYTGGYHEGYLSHVHFCDGYQYTASDFGSFDSTTGEWKINTSPSVSYGTNGFWVLKDGNTITDSSPNSNDFTLENGTLTKSEDNPSNVFSTVNILVKNSTTNTNGNLRVASGSSNWYGIPGTLAVDTGKFYWEYKLTTGASWSQCGVMSSKSNGGYDSINTTYVGNNSAGVALNSGNGDIYQDGSSGTVWFSGGLSEGDIIGVALDATNNKCYWSRNGTWGNSSNPATGTNGQTLDSNFTDNKPYVPAFSVHNCTIDINFGNGYFGTTAVSSAGTNASNNGIFEYDVPSGFTALSTKGLNI